MDPMSRATPERVARPRQAVPRRPRQRRPWWRKPGWLYRRLTARRRPLPDFLIIGAQRCGTTSTYEYLIQHPRILAAWRKEVRFFDAPPNYARGEAWYRAHFPRRRPGALTGEATPSYMFRPGAAARMARHVPDARLIALLRDPVDRAISHYHLQVRRGLEPRMLEQAIDEQPRERSRRTWGSASYLVRGLYAEQIEDILRVFPRDRLLVLASADLFARPAETVSRIFAFLGLPACAVDISAQLGAGAYEPAPAPVRARLVEFFRPHNERLYDLLGEDLGWAR
jgi:hypothetical protein